MVKSINQLVSFVDIGQVKSNAVQPANTIHGGLFMQTEHAIISQTNKQIETLSATARF